jgi:hypothetical protein
VPAIGVPSVCSCRADDLASVVDAESEAQVFTRECSQILHACRLGPHELVKWPKNFTAVLWEKGAIAEA